MDDAQTQWLPRSGDVLERAAGLLDLSPEMLWSEFERVREEVARGFDSVFHVNEDKSETNEQSWPIGWASGTPDSKAALIEKLLELGYDDAADELACEVHLVIGGMGRCGDERARFVWVFGCKSLGEFAQIWRAHTEDAVRVDGGHELRLEVSVCRVGELLQFMSDVTHRIVHLKLRIAWCAD